MRTYYRKFMSHLVVALCAGAVLLALVPVALILFYVVKQGFSAISWSFFTRMPAQIGDAGGGMANGIVGSLMVTGLGALFAIPSGIIAGISAEQTASVALHEAHGFTQAGHLKEVGYKFGQWLDVLTYQLLL